MKRMLTSTFRYALAFSFFFIFYLTQGQEYPKGILPGDDPDYGNISEKAVLTRNFYESTPPSFSLKRYAPYPGSQSPYGTCTGWAVAYAARTILEAQKNGWTNRDYITENAFSPVYQYRVNSDNTDCSGAYTSEVVASLKNVGSVPMKNFSFSGGDELCPAVPVPSGNHNIAELYKIEEYTRLWSSGASADEKVQRTKSSLAAGNPVVISANCPTSMSRLTSEGLWDPTEDPDEHHGGHAICVVSYDDFKFGGAFEVQNSWSTNYGLGGYFWVKYDDYAEWIYQAFELVQFLPPEPVEPILAGSLRLFDLDDQEDLDVSLAAKNRNWTWSRMDSDDEQYTYKVNQSLLSGSEMRMYIESEQSAFVYMLGTGEVDRSVAQLFPVDGISPALNYLNSEVALPSENHFFKMDNTVGKNYIILLFSREKLNISEIKDRFSNSTGNVGRRLKTATEGLLIPSEYINFSSETIEFSVDQNDSGKHAFAMVVQFNQVD